MTRDETRFSPNVGSLYSFVETSGWTVNATTCTYHIKGGITSGYYWSFTGYSQLQWYENWTWHDLASEKSGTYGGYGDKVYDSMNDTFNRQYVNRTVRVGNYAHAYVNGQSTSATAYIEYIVPALPPNATTVTATRNSNASVTLSWTEASGVKESVRIERSIDGSSYAEIATVSGSATSYTDNSTAADHTYTYRIRYYNQNAYGGYSSTSSVTMSPSAPTKITVARATSTNVNVTLTNPSSVATSIQWQVTYDGGSTWSSSTSVSGSPVTSFVASTNGGTVKIRVRNVNETGSSAWIVSDSVVTLVPPAPPTALEPSGIVNLKYGTLTFRWKHNPLDGSAQTEAHLHYTVGNQTMDIPISGTANTYTIDIHSQAPGASYSWKVRTKGADPSYSDWSSTLSGKLYAEPQIYFIAQNPPSTVTALPIPIEVGYSDPQFMACASAVMTIKRDGRTVYTEPLTIGSSRLTGQITAAELLPEQGATYTVSVTARSGSTLEATTNTTFTVDYIEPTHGTLQVQNEPDTGYASLLASFDNHASDRSYTGNTNSGIEVDGAAIRSMTVDGKSVQNGTPTPDAPVPVQVVGGMPWNQLAPNPLTISASTSTAFSSGTTVTAGHKYLFDVKFTITAAGSGTPFIGVYTRANGVNKSEVSVTTLATTAIAQFVNSGTSDGTAGNTNGNIWFYDNLRGATGTISDIRLIALTAIFGAGNEPTSVSDSRIAYIKAYAQNNPEYTASSTADEIYLSVTADGETTLTPIPLAGHVLASLPDGTKDVLTVDTSGHVTLTKRTGRMVFDGSESWARGTNRFSLTVANLKMGASDASTANGYMSHFIATTNNATYQSTVGFSYAKSVHQVYVNPGSEIYGTSGTTTWTTWLASNNTTWFYPLTESTTVDLGYITMPELADGCTVEVLASMSTPLSMVSYDGLADAESISVIRVNKDGSRTQLADHAANYTAIVDKYAPLNTAYVYEVVTYAESGAYAVEVTPNLLESTRWFAYWGENNIAWAQWNPSGSYTLARPEKKRVHYAGRKWPVSYDSKAMEQEHSMTWTVVDMDDWQNGFIDLMNGGGRGVYKGCDGWVFHADFDYNATPNYTSITRMGEVGLSITRIDGEQL